MNLNYTLKQLTKITNGKLIGDETKVVNQIVIDSRSPIISDRTLFVALKGNKVNGHLFCEAFNANDGEIILVSEPQNLPNVNQIVVKDTLLALQLIAKHHRQQYNIPVIGITGSNGKTIVKEWLYHVLKSNYTICRSPKSYNSQLGVALSVLELNVSHTLAIFEAGISQPNDMDTLAEIILPTLGVFTGIGDAHQSNFESLETKTTEKYKLFKNANDIITYSNEPLTYSIPFSDSASLINANLVLQTAQYFKLESFVIETGLSTLPSISMRLEKMEGKNGNTILNDAYSLDDKSLEIGINYLSQISVKNDRKKVVIIAPHQNKKLSQKMVDILNSQTVDEVILIGKKNTTLENITYQFNSVTDYLNQTIKLTNNNILITGARTAKLENIIPNLLAKKHITKLNVNLSAVRHNLNYYKSKLSANTMILAMVKAQSYGGGIVEMAEFLESEHINYFGVAYADEGSTLRQNNISTPILVMNPEQSAFDDMIANNLEPSIYNFEVLNQFVGALIRHNIKAFPIHIKLETGMNRLGFKQNEITELIAFLKAQPEVYVKSVFSHLAVADDLNEQEFTHQQIAIFKTTVKALKNQLGYNFIKHIANSEATLNYTQSHFDMVRIGIGLYGLMNSQKNNLEQVISFDSQVSQISHLKKGESVGYGRAFVSDRDKIIAVIPIGYADGLRRQLSQGQWQLLINDNLVPIVGNICMDMCMVDVSNIKVKIGDNVQIFGPKNSVFEMSKTLNTIPYEIISSISSRVHRVYIEE